MLPTDPSFVAKVRSYYAYLESQPDSRRKVTAVAMAEFAPGVVGVYDSWGDIDVLFDKERWMYSNPEEHRGQIEHQDRFQPFAERKLYSFCGLAGRGANFYLAFQLAKITLVSKVEQWFDGPVAIGLDD